MAFSLFKSVLLADQITVIGNQTSNVCLNFKMFGLKLNNRQSVINCKLPPRDPNRNPDHPQKGIDCSLARDIPLVIVSCESFRYFVSNPAYGRTEKQTQHDQKYNLF